MSSRSLSPPRWRKRGRDDDHRAEPSMTPLSLRPRRLSKPGRRAKSMPALRHPTAHVSRDRPSSPPPPSYAGVEHRDLHTPTQPQHQEEDSGSEPELDSPPHLVIITEPEVQDPDSPTSPGSPPSVDTNPGVSPKCSMFGSDTEEWHFSDDEEDPYYKSLVDDFIATADVGKSKLSEEMDKVADLVRQTDIYAEIALKHYNNDDRNKVKYELIKAITSCGIMERRGCYFHVNFTGKGNQRNSKEELFFAEICCKGDTSVVTCVLPLEEGKKVGGLRESSYDNFMGKGLPYDEQHCYACRNKAKHPKDGKLYETGHIAISDYYHG